MKTTTNVLLLLVTILTLAGCSKPSVSTATIQVQYSDNNKVEAALQKIVTGWNNGIEVRRIRNTDLYQISFSDQNPVKAADAVSKAIADTKSIFATAFPDANIREWESAKLQ